MTGDLGSEDTDQLTPLAVAEAVMAVRRRKLPDRLCCPMPEASKNLVVSQAHEDIVSHFGRGVYPVAEGVKLAAAWLIDQAGWKGYRNATVGVHNRQALVLINHSEGGGQDILALAQGAGIGAEQVRGGAGAGTGYRR